MTEGEIYYFLKRFLLSRGWRLLAGEPPDGSDSVPRVEIRSRERTGIGSKGSIKIDLIFLNDGVLFLIELKPSLNRGDIEKLNEVTTRRLSDLFDALEERFSLDRKQINRVVKCVGVGTLENRTLPSDFVGFLLKKEGGVEVKQGTSLTGLKLFED